MALLTMSSNLQNDFMSVSLPTTIYVLIGFLVGQFIDNVSVEYQMDKAGERFAQVYHKRITDNVIEGEYSETGEIIKESLYKDNEEIKKIK